MQNKKWIETQRKQGIYRSHTLIGLPLTAYVCVCCGAFTIIMYG